MHINFDFTLLYLTIDTTCPVLDYAHRKGYRLSDSPRGKHSDPHFVA